MFRKKTVLVVGAGASCDLDFPTGPKLLKDIAGSLENRHLAYNQVSGDPVMQHTLQTFHSRAEGRISGDQIFQAAQRIISASTLAASIDNIIEQHDDDQLVEQIGKIAIVRQILLAENSSRLTEKRDRPQDSLVEDMQSTWFFQIGRILAEGVKRTGVSEVLKNLSIVCFNYDRNIEQFLPYALEKSYGISLTVAREIISGLRIFHPYGTIGRLPWQKGAGPVVDYGYAGSVDLIELAPQIRTFSERVEERSMLDSISLAMAEAQQVIFLGFGFLRQNMELIAPSHWANSKRVYATAYEVSHWDQNDIRRQMIELFKLDDPNAVSVIECKCAELFYRNALSISAPPSAA